MLGVLFIEGPYDGEWLIADKQGYYDVAILDEIKVVEAGSVIPESAINLFRYRLDKIAWSCSDGSTKFFHVMLPINYNNDNLLQTLLDGYRRPKEDAKCAKV